MDARAQTLLKTLIERYIVEGQPVGSRTLSRHSGLELSPATIRNVMSDLEEMGFIASPHTSAGRIPTALGYRLFVDSLLTVKPLERAQIEELQISLQPSQPQQAINAASQLLSQLTQFAGVVIVPQRNQTLICQIEFIPLSDKRILLILVTDDGNVQNRILHTQRSYSQSELSDAASFLNQHYAGQALEQMQARLREEIVQLRSDMTELMKAAIAAGEDVSGTGGTQYIISGERNLLGVEDLYSNMSRLRQVFDLFEQKTSLAHLLDISNGADGVQVFIGSESGIASLEECSVITAPYVSNGEIVGTLGVIGPTRMAYERIIPIVDITARLLSNALTGPN